MNRKPSSLKSRIIVIALGIALGYMAKTIFRGQPVDPPVSTPVSSERAPQD